MTRSGSRPQPGGRTSRGARATEERRPARIDPAQPDHEPVTVSVLAVPLFFGALILCAVGSYLLGPLALILVVAVAAGAFALALRRPDHREAAVAAVGGALLGFGGVMAIALLHLLG